MPHPRAEPAIANSNGDITQVHCIVCSTIEGCEKLYVLEIDGL